MRKLIGIFLLVGWLLLSLPTLAQDRRWDGADELPTDPLACGIEEASEAQSQAYNGGQAINPPALAGQTVNLVNIPKTVDSSYYEAVTQGMQLAARELGNVSITTDAPPESNRSDQVIYIDTYVNRAVDGILLAANDPADVAPALSAALGSGIRVLAYDSDAEADTREWFVNPAQANWIAKALVDRMADEAGPDGRFGIVTDTFDSAAEARLIAEMGAYARNCFPNMEWLETVEAQEDPVLAFNQAAALSGSYGGDLDGLFGLTTTVTPSLAEAISRSGRCGDVAIVGLGMPDDIRPYMQNGCIRSVVLWNPVDLGYATVYVMRAVMDGTFVPDNSSVNAGRLGVLPVVNGSEVLLGVPLLIDAGNMDRLGF